MKVKSKFYRYFSLLAILGFIGIAAGCMCVGLLIWNQQETEKLFVNTQLDEAKKIITNSLSISVDRISSYLTLQTDSEELEEALLENEDEDIYEELVTIINQSESVANFNIEILRVFFFKSESLQHFLSVHDRQESSPSSSSAHKTAFQSKIEPTFGLTNEDKLLITVIRYFSVFDLELGEVTKEGVYELGVSLRMFLRTIKLNFENTEVAFYRNEVFHSTQSKIFSSIDLEKYRVQLERKQTFSVEHNTKDSTEQSALERHYRMDFIPMQGLREEVIGYVILARDQSIYKQNLTKNLYTALILSLLFTAVIIFFGLLVLRTLLTKPLDAMMQTISKVSSGDLISRTQIKTKDEIGVLVSTFNSLLDRLSNIFQQVFKACKELTNLSGNLSTHSLGVEEQCEDIAKKTKLVTDNSTEIMKHTEKVLSSTVAVSKETNHESQATLEVNKRIQGIDKSIEIISSNAHKNQSHLEKVSRNVRDLVSEVKPVTESFLSIVQMTQNAVEISGNANISSQKSSETIKIMANNTTRVEQFSNTINHIAQQTNMLALNATIEAASAGEHGKGFSVVANEVKQLSLQTTQASQQMTKDIQEIKLSTNQTLEDIEKVNRIINNVAKINLEISNSIETPQQTLYRLSEEFERVVVENEESIQNMNHLSREVDNISQLVRDLHQLSESLTKSVLSTAEMGKEIEMQTQETNTSIKEINSNMIDIYETIKQLISAIKIVRNDSSHILEIEKQLVELISYFKIR